MAVSPPGLSHVDRVAVGGRVLLGVPLLALLASLHLGEQRLAVRLVRLDDALQLLHEEQLQHALVRVQVHQLKQLPLQDVVVPTRTHTHVLSHPSREMCYTCPQQSCDATA